MPYKNACLPRLPGANREICMPCAMNGVTVLGSCFRALVPAWDRFFPTGGGLAWISAFWPSPRALVIVTYLTNSDEFRTLH